MKNLPTDCIIIISGFLSHKEAHNYIQTSKTGNNDISETMPGRKKEYFEKKLEYILSNITLDTTSRIQEDNFKPYMEYIKNHYKEWTDDHKLSIIAESYKKHFIENKLYFIRMNKKYSFVAYIIMSICH